jgi:hypothetical protein
MEEIKMEQDNERIEETNKIIEEVGNVSIKNNSCKGCNNLSREFAKFMGLVQRDAPDVWEYYLEHLRAPTEDENEGQSEAPN